MSSGLIADLFAWLRLRDPPRDPPPFAINDLPLELQQAIARKVGIRPLLRLAITSRTSRVIVDKVFVHFFNRDIWAYLAWPAATESDKAKKENEKAMVRSAIAEHTRNGRLPRSAVYSEIYNALQNPVPPYLYLLLFDGPETNVEEAGMARAQKLRLANLYHLTARTLADGFLKELLFAWAAGEQGKRMVVAWSDPEVPDYTFTATFTPLPALHWPWDQRVTFELPEPTRAPALVRHVAAFARLAPTLKRAGDDLDIKNAWINAFINLLLDVAMCFESVIEVDQEQYRRLGLKTMLRPYIFERKDVSAVYRS
jgi:hypothetical protein